MLKVVKVQFHTAGKLYDFNAGNLDLHPGDKVIVETERGRSIATVVIGPLEYSAADVPEVFKTVLKKAIPEDLEAALRNASREKEAFDFCLAKIKERGMEMKLVRVEYLFDGSKAIFYFTADGRVDFRELGQGPCPRLPHPDRDAPDRRPGRSQDGGGDRNLRERIVLFLFLAGIRAGFGQDGQGTEPGA